GADLRLPDEDIVSLAIDRVAGGDLERHIAALARQHLQLAHHTADHAGAVEVLVVEPMLVDRVAEDVVEILLLDDESLEEVRFEIPLFVSAHRWALLRRTLGSWPRHP